LPAAQSLICGRQATLKPAPNVRIGKRAQWQRISNE
jgi:hypothetical protein